MRSASPPRRRLEWLAACVPSDRGRDGWDQVSKSPARSRGPALPAPARFLALPPRPANRTAASVAHLPEWRPQGTESPLDRSLAERPPLPHPPGLRNCADQTAVPAGTGRTRAAAGLLPASNGRREHAAPGLEELPPQLPEAPIALLSFLHDPLDNDRTPDEHPSAAAKHLRHLDPRLRRSCRYNSAWRPHHCRFAPPS